MLSPPVTASIIDHLGGRELLAGLGVRNFVSDDRHLSFTLARTNPRGVGSVTISVEPRGLFHIMFHGRVPPGSFSAPVLGTASGVIAENLASVLGEFAGIDALRHRHI